jgi:hypothetical protein
MKLNPKVIVLGLVLAIVSISIGCSKSAVQPSADVTKTANDSDSSDDGNRIEMTRATIPSTKSTMDSLRSFDSTVGAAPEIEIKQRQWQDYEYQFSTQATLTGFSADGRSVKLLKSNGVNIEVEISILCDEDQQYLRSITVDQREKLSAN